MSKDEKKKKVIIEVIETPRGPVPSAESLKTLVNAWNSILESLNENLANISKMFSEILSNLNNLDLSMRKIITRLSDTISILNDIKVLIKNMGKKIEKLDSQIEKTLAESKTKKEEAKKILRSLFEEDSTR